MRKHVRPHKVIYLVALLMLLFSCSRTTLNLKKNTWLTRTYHNTTSKYNVYFNGNEAYEDGLAKIEDQHQDDYTRVLPIFKDVNHESYASAKAEMDYAIEKANKIIQLHSIKIKPPYKSQKMRDPEYRKWRSQEEFNKMIDDAYLMMGKATFYKGEFMEAIGVFSYVTMKYAGEPAWYEANLWIARAYAEMGWLYEAENMLNLVNDENLPYQLIKFYNIVCADFYIKKGQYQEALPFLKTALEERFKKPQRQRYQYILAQIYQEYGQDELAYEYYQKVVRSIPDYEMEFNARIRMTEVMVDQDNRVIRKLNKMLRDPKNLEYHGEIYYALGNVYMTMEAYDKAIDNYRLSLEFSEGLQKGVTANTIAELYWKVKDYRQAAPYYAIAAENLPEDYPNAYVIQYRAETLKVLEEYYDIIGDKDREYQLALMSEAERALFLENEKKEAEREDEIQRLIGLASGQVAEEEALQEDRQEDLGAWYFYNSKLLEQGKETFREQWGDRPLKDNWRRIMSRDFSEAEDLMAAEDQEVEEDETEALSASEVSAKEDSSALAQSSELPVSPTLALDTQVKSESDQEIVDAYFNLASLYQYDLEDLPKAIETYKALLAQYPVNSHSADSYFALYNAASAIGDMSEAQAAKQHILSQYPASNYALILSNPEAKSLLLKDKEAYNLKYEETFALFQAGKNLEVLDNVKALKTEYRDTSLMAKVLLIEALTTAKVDAEADVKAMLRNIQEGYPEDEDVQHQVGIILAQMDDGKEIMLGGSAANTLSERRNKQAELKRQKILEEQQFRYEPETRHYMVMIIPDSVHLNKNHLQYDISKFNFNKFMTMDFDLSFGQLNPETSLMIVNGFSNEEEGQWYLRELLASNVPDRYPEIAKWYIISEENFRLLLMLTTFEEYDDFNNQH